MATAVRAAFFDFDGVLTRDKTGSLTTLRYLARETGIPIDRLREAFLPYNEDLNLGKATHAGVWPAICRKLERPIDIALLQDAFDSTPLNAPMLELAGALKRRFIVGIITDNKADRMARLEAIAGLRALFDPIVVSSEVGSDKGSAGIFEVALRRAGVAPHESVFIDNSASNLVAARALGMHAIHFDDEANDVAGLRALLRDACGVEVAAET